MASWCMSWMASPAVGPIASPNLAPLSSVSAASGYPQAGGLPLPAPCASAPPPASGPSLLSSSGSSLSLSSNALSPPSGLQGGAGRDRLLRITSEDDLGLPRYLEGIAIQSEPDSVTMYQRRQKILATRVPPPPPPPPPPPHSLPGSKCSSPQSAAAEGQGLSASGLQAAVMAAHAQLQSRYAEARHAPSAAHAGPQPLKYAPQTSTAPASRASSPPAPPPPLLTPLDAAGGAEGAGGPPLSPVARKAQSAARLTIEVEDDVYDVPPGGTPVAKHQSAPATVQAVQVVQVQVPEDPYSPYRTQGVVAPPPQQPLASQSLQLQQLQLQTPMHAAQYRPAVLQVDRPHTSQALQQMIVVADPYSPYRASPHDAGPSGSGSRPATQQQQQQQQQQQYGTATPVRPQNPEQAARSQPGIFSTPLRQHSFHHERERSSGVPSAVLLQQFRDQWREQGGSPAAGQHPTMFCQTPGPGSEGECRSAAGTPVMSRIRSCSPGVIGNASSTDFDWNRQFQVAVEGIGRLNHNTHNDERLDAYKKLSRLAEDFTYAVKTYARIIISEVYLPKEQKTIKPLENCGFAGGDKYVVQKILFKFAVDSKGIFGGDEAAAKVASHDLKSLVHICNCWEPGINFPMMALVDYRGFRIVGMTLLPISTDTLVYGSQNAGKTVVTNPDIERKLKRIAKKLNIKAHEIGEEGTMIYTPVDLEGHQGFDGKFYIVDFSRVFPPQSLSPSHKSGHLYQLLRPEFVRAYPKPLCSDAFSLFIAPNHPDPRRRAAAAEHNREIDEATQYLLQAVVPSFAERLIHVPLAKRAEYPLIMLLHESGINVRYLGAVHQCVAKMGDEDWSARLVIEMTARVIKEDLNALLRRKMRDLRQPGEGAYRRAVIDQLNLIFGSSPSSSHYWAQTLTPAAAAKFPPFIHTSRQGLYQAIAQSTQRLGLSDGRCLLFNRVAVMLGLRFSGTTWREINENPKAFDCFHPLTETDLKEIRERVKEMNIAAHSSGFVLKMRAKMTGNPEERKRLLTLAVQQLQRALEGNPDNKVTLRNLADCLTSLDELERASDCYTRALQADPHDCNTLYKYAVSLDKWGHLDEAEEHYLRALEECSTHSNCCYTYADFLCHHRKNFDEAEKFYQKAIEVDPCNTAAYNNYAVFLATVRHDYDRAELMFQKGLSVPGHESITHTTNYAAFLLHIRRNPEAAATYLAKARKLRVSATWL
eukprot:m51a1_g5210 hypothetical protein (1212) ;mRNA; r:242382-246294